MAACNLAMGTTLLLAGGSAYSVDNVLLRIRPALSSKAWFQWMGAACRCRRAIVRFAPSR